MIKANELRIGNWVELTNREKKVKGVVCELKQDSLLVRPSEDLAAIWCEYKDIEGIPITERTFQRCGFELGAGLYSEYWFNIDINWRIVPTIDLENKPGYTLTDQDGEDLSVIFYHVHEFQNIYLLLQGQEIPVTKKTQ